MDSPRRGITVNVDQLQTRALVPSELAALGITEEDVAERLRLEKVPEEIAQLDEQLEGEVLLDDSFVLERFEKAFASAPYRIVHIASHGFFGGSPEQNFILTYDKKLSMNRLAELLKPKQLADRPVELLGLSACQTAAGNDRTPLGLSGMALKSGARSVLGSLWPIYDKVALRLIPSFYAQLGEPGMSKAQALRRAQLELMEGEFQDPVFWAPFVLVGNWL
jgi:CHAT domain-containing protein